MVSGHIVSGLLTRQHVVQYLDHVSPSLVQQRVGDLAQRLLFRNLLIYVVQPLVYGPMASGVRGVQNVVSLYLDQELL
jgi:hypothetical protein